MKTCPALLVLLAAITAVPGAQADAPPHEALLTASQTHRISDLDAVRTSCIDLLTTNKDDYLLLRTLAETYLVEANFLRSERMIRKLQGNEKEEKRARQTELAKAGLPYADAALAAASTRDGEAQARRVIGELYAHMITGMISGIRFGGKSLEHILAALELAPDDPECNRAQGLMYLYNPPMNGGDVQKAIETFQSCLKTAPESDVYLMLLAQAYRKKGEFVQAREAARKTQKVNPSNPESGWMLEALKGKTGK